MRKSKLAYDYFTIDYDISEENFFKPESIRLFIQRLAQFYFYTNETIKAVYYRKSANGHIHIKIVLKHKHDVFELILYRAYFYDDAYRLRTDLRRYFMGRDSEIMILWDKKTYITPNETVIKKAGKWKRLYP